MISATKLAAGVAFACAATLPSLAQANAHHAKGTQQDSVVHGSHSKPAKSQKHDKPTVKSEKGAKKHAKRHSPSTRIASTVLQPADADFASLRDAARRDDAAGAAMVAGRLGNYPIASYVEYYKIKPRIKTAPASEIRDFLKRYDGSAIADRLRNDWLLQLGQNGDWSTFDEQYPLFVLDDDLQVKCYALTSRLSHKQNVAAEAKALLINPRNYGDACMLLVTGLVTEGQFNEDDVWYQTRLAAEVGAPTVARRLAALANAPEGLVQLAYDRPDSMLVKANDQARGMREAMLIALGRVAHDSPDRAARLLRDLSGSLSPLEQSIAWAEVGLPSAQALAPVSVEYWRKSAGAPMSAEAYQWRVRSALRAGDWSLVRSAIESMPPALRAEQSWVYWLGRAYREQGFKEQADQLFQSISKQTTFYGQLALEELGQKTSVPARADEPTDEEMAAASSNPGLRLALRFFDMGMTFEAYREWNWQLRKMTDRQLLAAAEFARENDVLDRMVNTSERTQSEMDFTQRYPTPYSDIMKRAVGPLDLDTAWVYGVIRQESRFATRARSQVGAAGLMQVMPATAKLVARRIGMKGFRPEQINQVATNITLGTNYLSMIIGALDGSQTLATAAYNAGPGRPRAWRATLTHPVEGAIFAETIPFQETRGYVKNVLSNATYYAAQMQNKPQSLKARLGTVSQKGAGTDSDDVF